MTVFDRFERSLPALFDELAAARIPDYTDDLLARTGATRQRPGWAFAERWLPIPAPRRRLGIPRIPWRLGALVALLALTALVGAIVAGMLLRPPSFFGPGRNGEIVLVQKSGSVIAVDPLTGDIRLLVESGGAPNTKPIMSPDGSRFLLLRPSAAGSQDIFVVDLLGKETRITPSALTAWHYVGWSPKGDRILIRDDGGRILLLDATRPAEPVSLSRNVGMGSLWIGAGFNYRSSTAFRPPYGDEVMFIANDDRTLAAIGQDGTGLRTILDVAAAGLGVTIGAAEWSRDGSQIAFVLQREVDGPATTWIVNADGTNPRQLHDVGAQWAPAWSPDGTTIAFEYWTPPASGDTSTDWDFHPLAVVDVATGELRDVGVGYEAGYLSWEWSPDGQSILAVPRDGFGRLEIIHVATGAVTVTAWSVDQPVSWQRLPPDAPLE